MSHRVINAVQKCKSVATLGNHVLTLFTCNYCALIKTSVDRLLIFLKKVCDIMCDKFLSRLAFISCSISLTSNALWRHFLPLQHDTFAEKCGSQRTCLSVVAELGRNCEIVLLPHNRFNAIGRSQISPYSKYQFVISYNIDIP
jgi:hypothetical protein